MKVLKKIAVATGLSLGATMAVATTPQVETQAQKPMPMSDSQLDATVAGAHSIDHPPPAKKPATKKPPAKKAAAKKPVAKKAI
jgi:hypothetical protein